MINERKSPQDLLEEQVKILREILETQNEIKENQTKVNHIFNKQFASMDNKLRNISTAATIYSVLIILGIILGACSVIMN